MTVNHFIGIDVSKDDFWACFNEGGAPLKFINSNNGIKKFLGMLKQKRFSKASTRIGLESTGPYHLRLCLRCSAKGYPVVVINPLITNGQQAANVRKTKTDKLDATLIRFVVMQGKGYVFRETGNTLVQKTLVRERQYISHIKRNLRVKAYDIAYKEEVLNLPITSIHKNLALLLKQKMTEFDRVLRMVNKPTQALLQSIPGVGQITSAALVAEIGHVERFKTHRQFVAFLGIDPRVYESGTSVKGKGYITKRGNKLLRTLLFNCVSVAIQHENIFQDYYQTKISQGKFRMTALVATMHKMARVIYAVWKNNRPFQAPKATQQNTSLRTEVSRLVDKVS